MTCKQGKNELKRNLLAKLLEPSLFQLKDEIKVKSLRVVVASISASSLSVVQPWEEPFKSKRL